MIEMCHMKNLAIFIQTILSFVLSRKIINNYNDIARKYGNVTSTITHWLMALPMTLFPHIIQKPEFLN